ncbi:MAG: thioredoxin [Anaerolineales bacterium]|nr:thioredoxin [Anaerolineales bacterium]
MESLPSVTDSSFETVVLSSELPVLVDFGAAWCHPCRQLDPIVEELAGEWQGKAKIVKLDIDANLGTTTRFGVMSVPTLILFVAGEPTERSSGYQPKKKVVERFGPHLGL